MDRKWNLQDIRPSGERRKRPVREAAPEVEPEAAPAEPRRVNTTRAERPRRKSGSRKTWIMGLILVAAIVIPGIVIGYLTDGATLTVYPRNREPNVNATLRAYNEPQGAELSYDVMTLEAEGERQVRASGEEEAKVQATGEIEISNTRTTSERLVKNTRFESPEGYIYKITESAVVPAATKGANGETVPGTVRAKVFADVAGEQYNIGPSQFTVPGYKEGGYDELFAAITAKSTTGMQGGFVGTTFVIDDAELKAAQDSLHTELEEALRNRVKDERPAGFVMFDAGITFSYESLPTAAAANELVTIREKTLLHVPIFASGEFASYVAAATIPGYEQEPVRLENPDALTFAYTATSTSTMDLRNSESFEFTLMGKPLVIWTFDHDALKNELKGTAKTALRTILSSYPAIERAEAAVRPFWKRNFPADPADIEIVESVIRSQE